MDETHADTHINAHINLEAGASMCTAACAGAGHAVHPIQRVVASSTPSSWVDGFAYADGGAGVGIVEFVGLDGSTRVLWHHREVSLPGEPVAFHPVAGVLSVRGELVSVSW